MMTILTVLVVEAFRVMYSMSATMASSPTMSGPATSSVALKPVRWLLILDCGEPINCSLIIKSILWF